MLPQVAGHPVVFVDKDGAEPSLVHVPEQLLVGFSAGRLGAFAADRFICVHLQDSIALAGRILPAGPDLGVYAGFILLVA